ncbi:MAG: sulfatase-like hydrolase/transferase [Pseudomonadota bacterium]
MKPYNILFITTDQEQSFVDLPENLDLPAHERLRAGGTAFTNFQVNSTPCGPSRSVIYSGQHTQHTRLFVNPNVPPHPELPRDMPTLGSIFRELGYYTAYKGKWHLSHINHGLDFDSQRFPTTTGALEPWGFSEYTHDGDHHGHAWDGFCNDNAIAADAANWLLGRNGRKPGDQPWLMAVNFINPHDIMFFDATGRMAEERLDPVRVAPMLPEPNAPIYRDRLDLVLPASFHDDLSKKPSAHREDQRLADLMYGRLPLADEASWLNHRNYYFNCIRDVDRHVLTLLDALEKSGDAARTIVVFTSDHGEMAGAHGMRQKGASMYKENLRVSLMITHPDITGGVTTGSMGTSIDLIPTLLELAGAGPGKVQDRWPGLKGVSLADALTGQLTQRDSRGMLMNYTATLAWDVDFVETLFRSQVRGAPTEEEKKVLGAGQRLDRYACYRGINSGQFKFARYFKPAEHHIPTDWATLEGHNELELYDTAADPFEMNNLAADTSHRDLLLSLNTRLNELIALEIGVDDGSCYSRRRSYRLGDT